jgi:proteasome alpha subunit
MASAGSSRPIPPGTLLEYKATGIGIGRPAAMKVFEEEYSRK